MRSLIQILGFTLLLSYLQAEPDNPRLPKLGPTIVEKPYKLDEDLALIIKGSENYSNLRNITDLLTSRTYKQRMELSKAYKDKTLMELLKFLNEGCDGCQFDGLFTEIKVLLGNYVQSSLEKSKDWAYMSILCTSSASRLQMLKDNEYRKYLSADHNSWRVMNLKDYIHSKMNEHGGKKVLSHIIDADPLRPESGVDQSKFKKQLKAIPNLDTDCWTTNYDLLSMMAENSFDHIKAVDVEYRQRHIGKTILGQIDEHCKDDVKEAYRRIVMYAVDPFGYFADEFQAGLTDPNQGWVQNALSIVAYTRCEIDLKDIEAAYHIKYKKPLLEAMANWSSPSNMGNYILYSMYRGNTGNCP